MELLKEKIIQKKEFLAISRAREREGIGEECSRNFEELTTNRSEVDNCVLNFRFSSKLRRTDKKTTEMFFER
ncbi:hypothetical protein NECAME_03435 [Necator americanus]|uniref:Uncharacterized protein n=1 Tax=Necator americanus TaxID=51031 RepID=W2T3M5_NECAM|nr:hypothetical protein NECAME_03435 [Necator americanus]ETN76503.1 hypothetical protein NECAME_03435 [Necator americanus]